MASRSFAPIWAVVLLSLMLAAALTVVRSLSAPAEDGIQFLRASVGEIKRQVSAPCTLEAIDSVNIGSQVSGTISRVNVKFGDSVKVNDILIELDPSLLRSQLEEAHASREIALSTLRSASQALDRNKSLVDVGFVSPSTMEQLVKQVDEAQARVALSAAQLRRAETDVANTKIRAPIDGTVLKRFVEPGQTIAATFQTPVLLQLGRAIDRLRVEATIAEYDYDAVANCESIVVRPTSRPASELEGRLISVRPAAASQASSTQASNLSPVFVADIEVVNKGSGLIPGMTCTAQFFSKPAAGLRIPVAALRFRLKNDSLDSNGLPIGRTVVYVRRGNKAVPVPVKLGAINADFAEVVHGEIGPGDEVAVAYGLK